ncbi:sulfatase [bacterium]|nr:sulfatase [bacterium]
MSEIKNIIVIGLDALRAGNLGCYGISPSPSPNIDRMAERALLFKNAYTCINYTDPSFTSLFTGKYPLSHGILNHGPRVTNEEVQRFTDSRIPLLSEILQKEGFKTLAIDWLFRWHKRGYDYYSGVRATGSLRGFLKQQVRKFPWIRKVLGSSMIEKVGNKFFRGQSKPYEDAIYVTDQAIKLLKQNSDNKVFLFLHYWDVHTPYLPPDEFIPEGVDRATIKRMEHQFVDNPNLKETYQQYQEAVLRNLPVIKAFYNAEISFLDRELGRLFRFLDEKDRLSKSLIIILADHGESLGEHGIYMDHHGLYDQTMHIPLLILHPDFPDGQVLPGLVQNIDIMPTIFEILNLNAPLGFDGKNLLDLTRGEELYSEIFAEEAQWQRKRAIRTKEWKYIRNLNKDSLYCRKCGIIHGGEEELFDLSSDPEEIHNIASERPETVTDLRKRMDSFVSKFDYQERPGTGEKYAEDQNKLEQRLKDLGYF